MKDFLFEWLDDDLKRIVEKDKYYYFEGLRDQEIYLKAFNKWFPNKKERAVLDKYKYTGIPLVKFNINNLIFRVPAIATPSEIVPIKTYLEHLSKYKNLMKGVD